MVSTNAMSLHAKIEAVIYASEEPVTLQQLVSLLAEEAAAELDAIASQRQRSRPGAKFLPAGLKVQASQLRMSRRHLPSPCRTLP